MIKLTNFVMFPVQMLKDRVTITNAIVIQSSKKLPGPRINLGHHRAAGTEVGGL